MKGKKRCFPQDVYQSPKVNGAVNVLIKKKTEAFSVQG